MSAVDRIRQALKVSQEEPDPDTEMPAVVALWPGEAEALLRLADAARGIQPIALHSGPAAPTFDEFDRAVERNRGEWVSIDGAAYESLAAALARLDGGGAVMDADCHFGDHNWRGSGQCVRCGERLRCGCGAYIREDRLSAHLERCPVVLAALDGEGQ